MLFVDFKALTGTLYDCLQLDSEIIHIQSRANRDAVIKTNCRLLVDLCKTTKLATMKGRIEEDKHIREYTCVTHNEKSGVDYFLAEHSCFDSVLDFFVIFLDASLSDVHCSLVLELE